MSNTKSTKRNTTKKTPVESLQSDKAQGNTTAASTTKRATNVGNKPTVASLQKDVEGLKQLLSDANRQLKLACTDIDSITELYHEECDKPLSLIIYQRFTDWLYNVTKNFRE